MLRVFALHVGNIPKCRTLGAGHSLLVQVSAGCALITVEAQWNPNGIPLESPMESPCNPIKHKVLCLTKEKIMGLYLFFFPLMLQTIFLLDSIRIPLGIPLGFHWASIGLPFQKKRPSLIPANRAFVGFICNVGRGLQIVSDSQLTPCCTHSKQSWS